MNPSDSHNTNVTKAINPEIDGVFDFERDSYVEKGFRPNTFVGSEEGFCMESFGQESEVISAEPNKKDVNFLIRAVTVLCLAGTTLIVMAKCGSEVDKKAIKQLKLLQACNDAAVRSNAPDPNNCVELVYSSEIATPANHYAKFPK